MVELASPCRLTRAGAGSCLQTYFDPRPGDVYFFEEEELISLHSEKTSFRARIVLRREDASFPDLVMEWSCKMVLQKPARCPLHTSMHACVLSIRNRKIYGVVSTTIC